jgi:hypothetical protein
VQQSEVGKMAGKLSKKFKHVQTIPVQPGWYGVYDNFQGYEVCRAGLDYGNMSISGESTFNTRVNRSGEIPGLAFYAVVPKNRSSGQWIDAVLAIEYVPTGSSQQYNCQPDQSYPWLCKGQGCNPLSRMR